MNVSTHSGSRRTAIIDKAGEALWLYLSDPQSTVPANDCWLANLRQREPLSEEEYAELRAAGLPPPAPAAVLHDESGPLPTNPGDYALTWSDDGEAVQALLGERPIAFVVAGIKTGYHVNIRTDCPWGRVFDVDLHRRLFGPSA